MALGSQTYRFTRERAHSILFMCSSSPHAMTFTLNCTPIRSYYFPAGFPFPHFGCTPSNRFYRRESRTTMLTCFGERGLGSPQEPCGLQVFEEGREGAALRKTGDDRQMPVLLFDIMGTIVRDPFYDDIPAFFGLTMRELLTCKHPTAWVEFEKGLITEEAMITKFFSDGRKFDAEGLKACMARGYTYLEGMEAILEGLQLSGYEMHAFTNYPSWFNIIEEKLKLSKYLSWTFVSCQTGRRKPDPEAYVEAAKHLKLNPSDCVFIDDQPQNVDVASSIGMTGVLFQGASLLEKDLLMLGIHLHCKE